MRGNEAQQKELLLRGERQTDHADIYEVTKQAFGRDDEAKLIVNLRKTRNYIKGLSVAAILEGKLIGHAMLTQAPIVNRGKRFMALALAPISVLPEFQRRGFGTKLVEEVILRAKECGFKAVVVLGDPAYYSKFGFIAASTKKIRSRFSVPDENFMALELIPNALKGISGIAEYAREFAALKKEEPPKKEENAAPVESPKAEETSAVKENTENQGNTQQVNESGSEPITDNSSTQTDNKV